MYEFLEKKLDGRVPLALKSDKKLRKYCAGPLASDWEAYETERLRIEESKKRKRD